MASKKQLAWRKKFARMSKAGKFRKKASIKRTVDYSTKPISIKSEIKYGKSKKTERFVISGSERKQSKNLNVYSPPPEFSKIVIGKTQAQKVVKEKRKLYRKVKISKIKE